VCGGSKRLLPGKDGASSRLSVSERTWALTRRPSDGLRCLMLLGGLEAPPRESAVVVGWREVDVGRRKVRGGRAKGGSGKDGSGGTGRPRELARYLRLLRAGGLLRETVFVC